MTEELLQDLVLYRKEKEKAVSSAARALMSLFREICPSLLVKKDRGRTIDPNARPKAFGEVDVASNVPGIELLHEAGEDSDEVEDDDDLNDGEDMGSENEMDHSFVNSSEEGDESDDESFDLTVDSDSAESGDELVASDEDEDDLSSAGGESVSDFDASDDEEEEEDLNLDESQDRGTEDGNHSNSKKRKAFDFEGQMNVVDKSLRALKKLASANTEKDNFDSEDGGILSNEEFKRIKKLKAKAEARTALARHGLLKKGSDSKSGTLKIPTAEQLTLKRVDPATLEARMHRKMTKDERMALVKAGREDRGKYQAKTALKQKKLLIIVLQKRMRIRSCKRLLIGLLQAALD